VRALDLVRKVSDLRASFRRPDAPEEKGALGRRAATSVIRVTTAVARQMRRVPMPRPSAAERGALTLASAPLRAMVAQELVPVGDKDSPEAALVELVHETLALVDKLLEADPELARDRAPAELPAAPSADPTRHKVKF
jgi:hypothetical protein